MATHTDCTAKKIKKCCEQIAYRERRGRTITWAVKVVLFLIYGEIYCERQLVAAAETDRETKNATHEEQDQPVCALPLDVWASSDTRGRSVATASCPVPLELRNNGELL